MSRSKLLARVSISLTIWRYLISTLLSTFRNKSSRRVFRIRHDRMVTCLITALTCPCILPKTSVVNFLGQLDPLQNVYDRDTDRTCHACVQDSRVSTFLISKQVGFLSLQRADCHRHQSLEGWGICILITVKPYLNSALTKDLAFSRIWSDLRLGQSIDKTEMRVYPPAHISLESL